MINIKQLLENNNFNDKYILKLILQDVFDFSKEQLYLNWDKEVSVEQFNKTESIYKKYEQDNIPIEYLLGRAFFMGEKFIVNENTLIPRPETEYLVNCVLEEIKKKYEGGIINDKFKQNDNGRGNLGDNGKLRIDNGGRNQMKKADEIRGKNVSSHPDLVSGSNSNIGDAEINSEGQKLENKVFGKFAKSGNSFKSLDSTIVFDIGTGSGIIGIMLNKLTKLPTVCSDIRQDTLQVAIKNNERLNKDSKNIKFIVSNLAEHIKQIESGESIIDNGEFYCHPELVSGSGESEINSKGQVIISGNPDFIICANLPYVEENFQLDEYTKKEPETALFAGQDGLDLYRELLDQVVKIKNKKIILFFELMTKQVEAIISEYKDFKFEILDTFHHNIKVLKIRN